MNTISVNTKSILSTVAVDALMMAAACLIPAASHLTALPLYQANPMLLILLAGMLLVRDRRNAYLMAVLLPVCSNLIVGMPVASKLICMIPEYLTVVALFQLVGSRLNGSVLKTTAAILAAMLGGKVVYYALKAIVMGSLFATPVALQVVVMLVSALLFAWAYNKKMIR